MQVSNHKFTSDMAPPSLSLCLKDEDLTDAMLDACSSEGPATGSNSSREAMGCAVRMLLEGVQFFSDESLDHTFLQDVHLDWEQQSLILVFYGFYYHCLVMDMESVKYDGTTLFSFITVPGSVFLLLQAKLEACVLWFPAIAASIYSSTTENWHQS